MLAMRCCNKRTDFVFLFAATTADDSCPLHVLHSNTRYTFVGNFCCNLARTCSCTCTRTCPANTMMPLELLVAHSQWVALAANALISLMYLHVCVEHYADGFCDWSTHDLELKHHRAMQHVIIESLNTACYSNLWLQTSSAHQP